VNKMAELNRLMIIFTSIFKWICWAVSQVPPSAKSKGL